MELSILLLLIGNLINVTLCYNMKLTMPGVIPEHDDAYLCSSFPIPTQEKESYIKSYQSTTNSSVAHHILLYGCAVPYSSEPYYACGRICQSGDEKIIFAWAKDAEKFEYPQDAGMAVGGKTGINYLVLQVHYLKRMNKKDESGILVNLSYKVPEHLVSIGLLFSYYGDIPANTGHVNLDISCSYQGKIPAYPLAFRTHAHALGRSISGFRVSGSNGEIDLIGKGNPQWPQTFYKANSNVMIMPGDVLMARCVFDATGIDHTTSIGATHHDEMCNFYIMLVSRNKDGSLPFNSCGGNEFKDLWKNVPEYSREYGPPQPSPDLFLSKSSKSLLTFDSKWKVQSPIGEVTSVAILPRPFNGLKYTLLVLHRSDRLWGDSTFKNNIYTGDTNPISDATILNVDPITGNVIQKAGENLFFMPHGITVTKDGKYIWLTDVALHQVMRFPLQQIDSLKLMDDKPDMIFGEKLVPGNDRHHFCKPSKVAVDKQGFIFVADGYCNSRVVCFFPNGTYADEWRIKDMMIVVHSITIEEDDSGNIKKNIVWVADRENQRIVGFKYDGNVEYISSSRQFGMPIYAIEFNPMNKLIYGVSTNGMSGGDSFIVDYRTNTFSQPWHSNYHMTAPHDLCLAENGNVIFVAELHLKVVVKFSLGAVDNSHLPPVNVNVKYVPFHGIISKISPTFIGLTIFLTILCVIFCVLLLRLVNRYMKRGIKKKRYGPMYKDKDGFQPLTQNDNNDDIGDSDPETEEFTAPTSRIAKKPKA